MIFLLIVSILVSGAVLTGRAKSPVSLILGLAIPSGYALSNMPDVNGTNPTVLVCTYYAVFGVVAYSVHGRLVPISVGVETQDRWPRSGPATAIGVDLSRWPSSAVAIGVCALTGLHFALGGIPILESDVETARFDFNSGLFGLPGRASLIALPIVAVSQLLRPREFTRNIVVLTWGVLVLSRLFMGFKGAMLELVVLVALAFLASGRRITLGRTTTLAAAGAAGLVFAAWMAAQYRTLAGQDFFREYLIDRLGRQAAEPGWVSLQLTHTANELGGWFLNDLRIFADRYFGIGTSSNFAADERVSALVTGTPLSDASFLVPVTIGGPAYVWGSVPQSAWAWPGFVLAVALVSWLFGRAVRVCRDVRAPMPVVLLAVAAIVGIKDFCLNGGGAYLLVNYLLVVGLISVASMAVKTGGATAGHQRVRSSERGR